MCSSDLIDTSDLPLPALRQAIEARFGGGADGMSVCLTSFAFPRGLPADADMVFDARFLRNPHYDPALRPLTGLDPAVAADVARDPDHDAFLAAITAVADLALPRFAAEGKKYATVAIGCTGGRHRSVHLVERLAAHLSGGADARGWRLLVTHRELAREGTHMPTAPEPRT